MPEHYLLPLTHTDFLDWYNRRHKAYSGLTLIPAGTEEDGVCLMDGWESVLQDALPDYEEDFQVLIALVEVDNRKRHQFKSIESDRVEVAAFQSLDICAIQRLYPITKRGARMLNVRLPEGVTLAPPIFEDVIKAKETERLREQQKAGGNVLLEMFGLEMHEGEIAPLREEILRAVHAKITRQSDSPPSTLLESVIRYDRQDQPSFPSTPIGTLFDYMEVLRKHLRKWYTESGADQAIGEQIRDTLEKAGAELRDMGRHANPYEAVNNDVLRGALQELEEIADLDFDRCPPEAAILYLDVRDQLREDDSLKETTLKHWTETLKAKDNHRRAAIGLWMVGAFFGFSTFADAYYEDQGAPFLQEMDLNTEERPQLPETDSETETSPREKSKASGSN